MRSRRIQESPQQPGTTVFALEPPARSPGLVHFPAKRAVWRSESRSQRRCARRGISSRNAIRKLGTPGRRSRGIANCDTRPHTSAVRVRRFSDAASFLEEAGSFLEEREALHNLPLSIARRCASDPGRYAGPNLFAVVEEASAGRPAIRGVAMMTP